MAMRGALKKLPPLSVARACIVTAALCVPAAVPFIALAGQGGAPTAAPDASSRPESVAYAIPRSTPANGAEVVLAQPLAPSDVTLYRRIFADQEAGRIEAAKTLAGRLQNRMLMGQVLAQLYLGPHHHSTPAELEAWLEKYNGEPGTLRIRALLQSRLPHGRTAPAARVDYLPEPELAPAGAATPSPQGVKVPPHLARRVDYLSRKGDTSKALGLIADNDRISRPVGADLRGRVARQLFAAGRYREAFDVASKAAKEGGNRVWRPDFIAGLAAWQMHDIATALPFFEKAAAAPHTSDDQRAAGAFWAARAALRLRQPDAYLSWLTRAANADDSFYGMLATRLLGRSLGGGTGMRDSLSEADVEAVAGHRDGMLAFALIQVGRPEAASRALRALWPAIRKQPELAGAVMRVAARAGLIDVAVALNARVGANEIAGAKLPLPALHPVGGFTVDPSLVYALTRTESGFDPHAVSSVGARGLMQLMPVTARAMARRSGVVDRPEDPAVNLALGQSYLLYLGSQPGVNRNLLDILASYNAGPVAASKWEDMIKDGGDPLIFIESIPNPETRRFVHQVLADSWLYAAQFGQTPGSLTAVAEGRFPTLEPYGITLADR